MLILSLIFISSCKYKTIKSRFISSEDGFIILDRTPYPGRYIVEDGAKSISSLTPHSTNKIRAMLRDLIFYQTLGMDSKNREVILAIVLGEKLPKEWRVAYDIGISHFFATSGLHILVILSAVTFIFGNNILTLAILWVILFIYTNILYSPSIMRAFIFYSFKLLANLLGEVRCKYREFIWAFIICSIFCKIDISFHLTFCATFTFLLFDNLSLTKISIIIPIITSIPSLHFFGKTNLISFIPNILLSLPLHLLIVSSFLNILIPIGAINSIIIETILNTLLITKKFFVFNIEILVSKYFLRAYYLFLIVLLIIIKKRLFRKYLF